MKRQADERIGKNVRLKNLVAELSLDNSILKDVNLKLLGSSPQKHPSDGMEAKLSSSPTHYSRVMNMHHHESVACALECLGNLCYDVAKPCKECLCL